MMWCKVEQNECSIVVENVCCGGLLSVCSALPLGHCRCHYQALTKFVSSLRGNAVFCCGESGIREWMDEEREWIREAREIRATLSDLRMVQSWEFMCHIVGLREICLS